MEGQTSSKRTNTYLITLFFEGQLVKTGVKRILCSKLSAPHRLRCPCFCGVMRRCTCPACVIAFRMGAVQGWYWEVRESSYSYHAWAAASSYSFTLQAFPVVRHARLNCSYERKEATKNTYTGTLKGHLFRPMYGHKQLHSQRQTILSFTGGSTDDSKFIGLHRFY